MNSFRSPHRFSRHMATWRKTGVVLLTAILLLVIIGAPSQARPRATITVDGVNCKLADAIYAANNDTAFHGCSAGSGADTLDIVADLSLTSYDDSPPGVESDITIEGNNHIIARENTTDLFSVLKVYSNGKLTLKNATIRGGDTGVYCRSGEMTVQNSTITNNASENGSGGGIYGEDCTITIEDSTISDNTANKYYGGGIFLTDSSDLTVRNCDITGNTAGYSGGGIRAEESSTVTIEDSAISGNSVGDGNGGGIAAEYSNVSITLKNTAVTDNEAIDNWGGGIYCYNYCTLTIQDNSTISDNTARDGGGVYAEYASTVGVTNSTISGNTVSNDGGGVYVYNSSSLTVDNSAITGNTSSGWGGGGIRASLSSPVTMRNSTLSGNTASRKGGGIYSNDNGTDVILENCTISNNSADSSYGGGVHCYSSSAVTVKNSIIADQADGYDCYNDGGSITSDGYNLESGTSCGFTATDDLQNTDPKLNALSGGVMVPQSNSPAIDGGNPAEPGSGGDACLGSDQRGNARDDLRCDMGAVEVQLSDTDTVVKDVSGAETYTFGPTLVKIAVTDQGALSRLQVTHHDGDHPNATRMNGQWWEIAATGDGFSTNLDLPHSVSPDTNASVCKYVSGSTWDCARDGSTADRVWRNGVTAFSDWSVGDHVGPNSIILRRQAARRAPDWTPILWASLLAMLAAIAGVWRYVR